MADMYVLVETARSTSYAAVQDLRLAPIAKVHCSETLSTVAGEMIQLHGGIAITWEHDAQLVFKRAHALTQLVGQPHQHRARITL
jgi:alkylation response protein AidB-like acyl-CoA dehydrogenase